MQHRGTLHLPLARNGARGQRRTFQCRQANVVGISKSGFLATHCAHTDSLLNTKAAGFNDAFFQRPTLGAAILKIQIGIIHAVRQHFAEHLLQMVRLQRIGSQQ